jgi:hypothetical protein
MTNTKQTPLEALNDWCNFTGQLFLSVRYYGNNRPEERWEVKICPHSGGIARPMLSRRLGDIEASLDEMLAKAMAIYSEQCLTIIKRNQEAVKHNRVMARRETAEIEAMHRTAGDY